MDTRPATSSSTNSAATRAAALPPQPDELQTAEEPLPEFLPEEAVSALDPDTADNELPPMLPAMSADAAADAVLEALLAGRDISTELEATAAGLSGTGGGDEGGNGFIRLGRVSETTTPIGFVFPTETTTTTLPEDQRLLLEDNAADISGLAPTIQNGDASVDENDLSGQTPTTTSGSFIISAPDGVDSLVINGVTVISNGVLVNPVVTTPLGNELTITGYNPATGEITYEYELLDNEVHPDDDGVNPLFDEMDVVLTDNDGDSDSDVLSIQVLDDLPDAVDDAASISEDTPSVVIDILANDDEGADGASASVVSPQGTYGNLTQNGDGTWTYHLDTGNPVVQGLGVAGETPETLTDTFTYNLTDTDGDIDTANIVVTITGVDDPVVITNLTPSGQGGDALVDEDDLPDGSDTSKEPLTTSGNFSISAPDGVDDLTIGGQAVITDGVFTATSFVTALGNTLNITAYDSNTGVVSYSYTLADNETHTNANGQNSLFEDFSVVLTDEDGDSTNNTLSINIVDDVPDAINNTDPDIVSENSTVTTGNVLGNDVQGADGASVTPAVIAGTYGTLTLNADGSYSYTLNTSDADFIALNGGGSDTEVFTYTLTDADGDSDTATLTLNIHNDDDGVFIFDLTPQAEGGDSLVDEDDLPDGSDTTKEPVAVTGDFAISAEDGISTISIGGTLITYAELANSGTVPIVIATALGNTLTINGYTGDAYSGTIYGTYTLNDNETHTSGNGENSRFDALAIIVTDTDGDNTADILSIQIVDDVPQAFSPLSGHVNNADGSSGSFALDIDGNIDNNTGADQTGTVRFATTQEGASSLTSLGETIYFYVSADGQTLTGSTALTEGAVSDGNTIFTVALNQDGDFDLANDSYTVTMSGTIDNGSGVAFTDLSGTGEAGNPSFKIVESGVAGQEILFSPAGGATSVNSDSNDVAVDSQFIDAPEGLRIDFGEFSTANGGDDYLVNANNTINGFSFSVDQISGGTTASILLKAYDADTDENLTNDPLDPITKILVYSALGILLATSDTGNAAGVTFVDHGDGTWTVSGVQADYSVVTLTDDGYSRIEIYNDDTNATDGKFSLSNLEVLVTDTGTPIEQGFDLTLTDTDGDSVDGSLSVTFEPAALATGTTITGTADADTLYGGAGNDTLNGLAGNDLLDGGSGNDIMDGGADNDTLIGNSGNDTMTGGTGADVFVWQLGEGGTTSSPAEDTITDFADGIGGDQLDLRDLLVGEESAPLTDYLHFDLDGSDTVISVSSTGAFDGSNYASATDQRIVLSNVDLVTGSSGDTDIISNLVASSNLRTDV